MESLSAQGWHYALGLGWCTKVMMCTDVGKFTQFLHFLQMFDKYTLKYYFTKGFIQKINFNTLNYSKTAKIWLHKKYIKILKIIHHNCLEIKYILKQS